MPKDLLDDEPEDDLSPLDLAMDINELVNLGSEGSDSQGKLSKNSGIFNLITTDLFKCI